MYKYVFIYVYICRRIPPRAGEGQAVVGGGSAQSMPCFTIRLRAKQKGWKWLDETRGWVGIWALGAPKAKGARV